MRPVFNTWLLLGLCLTAIFLNSSIIKVASNSMLPTLRPGALIVIDRIWPILCRITGHRLSVNRGDIIVFRAIDGESMFVKRVVGLPTDQIRIESGDLVRNGHRVSESYVFHSNRFKSYGLESWPLGSQGGQGKDVTIPAGSFFVLGDNREESSDSRSWGSVPEDRVVGVMVWLFAS